VDPPSDRVDVVPLLALSKAGNAYTYSVPPPLRNSLQPGILVRVPFRNRPSVGVVVNMVGNPELSRVVDIQGVEDPEPVLLPYQLDLARWMGAEYAAPPADVLSIMLPAVLKRPAKTGRTTRPGLVEITDIGRHVLADTEGLKRANKQRALLEGLGEANGPVPVAALVQGTAASNGPLNSLVQSGLVRFVAQTAPDGPTPSSNISRPAAKRLSSHQQDAVTAIIAALGPAGPKANTDPPRSVFLLHGVTGSGKTEVYMTVIDEVLNRGQDAIVMVPEISLTPQALQRFRGRFPGLVASVHSRMPAGGRRAEWQRARTGQARIAIGPRSALFTPLANLGIIILDEEHDSSYKQEESPRYHARDVAIELGRMLGIPVVLGSATPDVGSYYHARKGRYQLLALPDRPVWEHPVLTPKGQPGDRQRPTDDRQPAMTRNSQLPPPSRPMPPVEIVDLRQELKAGNRGVFSRQLLAALDQAVADDHQALLFLNRRGAATSVVCRDCGFVATCKACDLPLTFHSIRTALVCHRCDRRFPAPRICPGCGGERIRYLGIGTQRVAEEVARALPHARVLRWDRDVTGRKDAHEAIAASFARHEADVLVGTQMIAKGLDFPLVTLVGVVVADVGLNLPDFRASERTFQLMTQVSGRAGRADLPSRVIVQAYNPDHYALQAAKRHDYWSFYRQEMTFRHASGYPPYSRLVRFLLKGNDDAMVGRRAHALRDALVARIDSLPGESFEVIGPAPAFTARVNDVFQWHLVARGERIHSLLEVVPDDVIVDIDPVDLL